MRLVIAGGRDFNDAILAKEILDKILADVLTDEITFMSGGARGADKIGEGYAFNNGKVPEVYKAQWDIYGNKAGPVRNSLMTDNADTLVAFHDGFSTGTAHIIKVAREKGLEVHVIKY